MVNVDDIRDEAHKAYLQQQTPAWLFDEYTAITDRLAELIKEVCREYSKQHNTLWIYGIDRDPETDVLIFHTLYPPDGTVSKKNVAHYFEKLETENRLTEAKIEDWLVKKLESEGEQVQRQVNTGAGIADVVTSSSIYEVKLKLTPASIFSAVGQLMIYRQSYNHDAKLYIVGRVSADTERLRKLVKRLGIEVIEVDHG